MINKIKNPTFRNIEIPDSYIDSFNRELFEHAGMLCLGMFPGFGNPLLESSKQKRLKEGFKFS